MKPKCPKCGSEAGVRRITAQPAVVNGKNEDPQCDLIVCANPDCRVILGALWPECDQIDQARLLDLEFEDEERTPPIASEE